VLPGVALVWRWISRGAALVAVPVGAVVGVAGAFAVGGQALECGAGLLPVAAAAGLVAAGLGAQQLGGRRVARLPSGRLGPPGALAGGVAPARAVPPRFLGGAGLALGGLLAGGRAGRARGRR
jgi:hypothetical protein